MLGWRGHAGVRIGSVVMVKKRSLPGSQATDEGQEEEEEEEEW